MIKGEEGALVLSRRLISKELEVFSLLGAMRARGLEAS
jgi:hypothetical protein